MASSPSRLWFWVGGKRAIGANDDGCANQKARKLEAELRSITGVSVMLAIEANAFSFRFLSGL